MNVSPVKVATSGGINWVWYLWYSVNEDGTANIIGYDRIHKDNPNQPAHTDHFEIVESDGRIAEFVVIGWEGGQQQYRVANPAYVFSYPGKV